MGSVAAHAPTQISANATGPRQTLPPPGRDAPKRHHPSHLARAPLPIPPTKPPPLHRPPKPPAPHPPITATPPAPGLRPLGTSTPRRDHPPLHSTPLHSTRASPLATPNPPPGNLENGRHPAGHGRTNARKDLSQATQGRAAKRHTGEPGRRLGAQSAAADEQAGRGRGLCYDDDDDDESMAMEGRHSHWFRKCPSPGPVACHPLPRVALVSSSSSSSSLPPPPAHPTPHGPPSPRLGRRGSIIYLRFLSYLPIVEFFSSWSIWKLLGIIFVDIFRLAFDKII